MTAILTGKKRLFQMTTKRKIILESIITTINGKIDFVDESGFKRLTILNSTCLNEGEREARLI